jgi:hypothetical protein
MACFFVAIYKRTLRTSFSVKTFACAIETFLTNQIVDEYLVSYLWFSRTSLCGEKRFLLEINKLARNQMKYVFALVFSVYVSKS